MYRPIKDNDLMYDILSFLSTGNAENVTIPNETQLELLSVIASAGTVFVPMISSNTGIELEVDPTVPPWAKQPTKPEYDYSEIRNTPTLLSIGETPGTAYDGASGKANANNIVLLRASIEQLQDTDDEIKTSVDQNSAGIAALREEFDAFEPGSGVDDETVKAIVEEETSPKFEEIESDITVIKRDLTNKQNTVSFDGDYNAKTNKAATVATVSREIAKLVADAPEAFNTLEEIAKWIAEHPESVAQLNALIAQNAEAIAQLQETAVTKTNVEETVDSALEEAKASGEFDGYTPVKGIDYFTESEKAEMVEAVIAALPTYDGAYTVTPSATETVLKTGQTYIDADIKIEKIPYTVEDNSAGGKTVIIG